MRGVSNFCVLLLLASALVWSAVPVAAQDDSFVDDPFDTPPSRLLVRVQVEFFSLPHETLTRVMRGEHAKSDPALHAHLRALVKSKGARILETIILTVANGGKATVESIMELIYPTEMEVGGLGSIPPDRTLTNGVFPLPVRPNVSSAFETRNTGVTLEVEASVRRDRKVINLRFAPEIVDLLRLEEWQEFHDQWGDASTRFPIFESLRTSTAASLMPGKFALVGVLSPRKNEGGADPDQKVVLFVKAGLIEVGGGE